jgi:hypothetical protein
VEDEGRVEVRGGRVGRDEVVLRREEESAGSSTSLETNENAGLIWRGREFYSVIIT